ncbi:MAG: hypothetical protein RL839_13820 [Gammaproteobacteria bacterium]
MKPEKSKWWFVGEMVMMILLGTAIFLIPRFHDAANEEVVPVSSSTGNLISPDMAPDIPLAFIDHAVVEISSWETDRIAPLLADDISNGVSELELDSVATTMGHALGDLEAYSFPQPVNFSTQAASTNAVSATAYKVDASYESGAADIVLHIVEENGEKALWKLNLTVDESEQDI